MVPCPRCKHILQRQVYPMERRPDHLDARGRHKWLTYWHCPECGHQCRNLPRPEYKSKHHSLLLGGK